MSTTTASIDVDQPIGTVYNQWTQFESFPEFMEGVEQVQQRDATHTHWRIKVGPISREFDATITEQHPEERVAWKSDDGPEHAGVVTFHRLDDHKTRVTTQMDVDPEGFIEQAADKLGILKARVHGDLERFKKFIESRPGETGAWRGDVSRPDA
ncbi:MULTISPECIES: SRPBCC family protein [unclassified Mycobacterium]|uniref:SRPBCC family protein n=1 Tax=unclassified Mycobacterium TaxID=2642494 RepID=UPI0007FB9D52|nr:MULTISPECIES: SRPBCC family protein [unclassified Mycobacterium]OBG75567.1 cyclase [Mycobacterium sp. E1214]OBH27203.1 cyclase [Mycobacterium sp. E1319]